MGLLSGINDTVAKARRGSTASSEGGPASAAGGSSHGPTSPRGSFSGGSSKDTPEGHKDDMEVLDKEEGHLLMSMVSQLRIGMDLSKIQFPTFVLEPRSLLERITDFMAHPEFIFGAGENPDAKERFLAVLAFYSAGWHIKPKGVKKPYNPILGEFFRCTYEYSDGSEGYYVAEQVSHHPPVSAFFYASPQNGVLISGEIKPKSKFLGNSAATIMDGENRVKLLQAPGDGEYSITMPNMFARGIIVGKMLLELGDVSTVTCKNTEYACDMDFKTKGWLSGGYNAVVGSVRGPGGSAVGEVSGHWHSSMEFKDKSGGRQTLFDVATATTVPKKVLPESEQEPNESRRLWSKLTSAIKGADMEAATTEKNHVEEAQRSIAREREQNNQSHEMRFFRASGSKFVPTLNFEGIKDPKQLADAIKNWIYGGKQPVTQPPTPQTAQTSVSRQTSPPSTPASAPPPAHSTTSPVPSSARPRCASVREKKPAASIRSTGTTESNVAIPTAPGPPSSAARLPAPPS